MPKEKAAMGRMAVRKEEAGAAGTGVRKEVRVRKEASVFKAIGIAEGTVGKIRAVRANVTVTCVRTPGIRVRRAYHHDWWLAHNNTRRSLARNTLQDCASKLPGHLHLLRSPG